MKTIPFFPYADLFKIDEAALTEVMMGVCRRGGYIMPEWVMGKITNALNHHHKAVKGVKVLILGIAYKKNVDDMRGSPAVKLMELLRDKVAGIAYTRPTCAGVSKDAGAPIRSMQRATGARGACRLRLRSSDDGSCRL